MFDSHCHLNFKAFHDDAAAVAEAMQQENVSGLVVGCDSKTSRTAINLAQTYPHLWASVGLHPTHVLDDPWDDIVMKELALEDRVVAIGEVGLDFYRFPEDTARKQEYLDSQYIVFQAAIDLAKLLNKPLVIHSRNAYDEIINVLQKNFGRFPANSGQLRGTIHCFMGTWQQAQQLLDIGFMIGFTGVITYSDADPTLLEAARNVPIDRLLIETDAPYLTPEPYRTEGRKEKGRTPRNIPQYTVETARVLAQLRQISLEEVLQKTEVNAQQLFHIEKQ